MFALFSGLLGTAFSVLIRMELSGPGVQYIADNQLYNSIITAHALLMIFFMVEKYIFKCKQSPNLFFALSTYLLLQRSENKEIDKVKDNNNMITIGFNDNNNNHNSKDPKYKYVKVLVNDPFNNRDIIAKVAKNQKGVYL